MPSAFFVDTNVLLYVKDPKGPLKRERAVAWLDALTERNLAVISPQVLNEFAHNIIKKFPHVTERELRENMQAMQPWCLTSTTAETALLGLAIHRRFKFSFYDATLVAAAITFGCDHFLSEDLGHNQKIGSMRVVNPFVSEPDTILERN